MQRRKRQLKAKEAGKVEAAHVSAGQAVLGMIATAGGAAGMTKVRASLCCAALCCAVLCRAVPCRAGY